MCWPWVEAADTVGQDRKGPTAVGIEAKGNEESGTHQGGSSRVFSYDLVCLRCPLVLSRTHHPSSTMPMEGLGYHHAPRPPCIKRCEYEPSMLPTAHCSSSATQRAPSLLGSPGYSQGLAGASLSATASLVSSPSGPFLMLFGKCIPFHSPSPSPFPSNFLFDICFLLDAPHTPFYIFSVTFPAPAGSEPECLFFHLSFSLKFISVSTPLPLSLLRAAAEGSCGGQVKLWGAHPAVL